MYNPKTGDARISGSLASLVGLEKSIDEKNEVEIKKSIKKIILLHSVIMSFGGIPLIYYGDELALTNDYSYLEDNSKSGDNRWMHRPIINWEKAELRKKEGTIEHKIYSSIKKMIEIRKNSPEFYGENDYEIIRTDNMSVFSFLRENNGERTLVLINFSDENQFIEKGILKRIGMSENIYDRFSMNDIDLSESTIEIKALDFLWIKEKTSNESKGE